MLKERSIGESNAGVWTHHKVTIIVYPEDSIVLYFHLSYVPKFLKFNTVKCKGEPPSKFHNSSI